MKTSILLVLVSLAGSSAAFGMGMDHNYYNKMRPAYQKNFYLLQQVQAVSSKVDPSLREGQSLSSQYGISEASQRHRGYSLQTSVGWEHMRFLKTGMFATLSDQTDRKNRMNGLTGQEFGAEARFILTSPIVNLSLGGAYFGSNKKYVNESKQVSLWGQGTRYSLELDYFVANNVNLVASASLVNEKLADSGSDAFVKSMKVAGQRYGAGLCLWL